MVGETIEKTRSIKDRVYNDLKQEIITLRLAPGHPLKEQDLAARFKVSRTPVREALKTLSHEGLVEIIPQKGAFVAQLDFIVIREIYQLREALEGLAARLAAPRIDMQELDRIEALLKSSKDVDEVEKAGRELHELIIQTAGNKRLSEMVKILRSQMIRIHYFTMRIPRRTQKSLQEHKEIISALRKKEKNLAEKVIKKHLRSSMESTLRAIVASR